MPEVTLVIIAPAGLVTVWRWLSVSLLSTADATRLQQMPLQLILYFRDRAEVMNSQEISVYNAVYSAPVGGPHAYFTVLCRTSKTVPRANKWLKFVPEQYLHFKCFQWLILIHCNICCWSAKPIRCQHTAQVFVHCSTSASETKQVSAFWVLVCYGRVCTQCMRENIQSKNLFLLTIPVAGVIFCLLFNSTYNK